MAQEVRINMCELRIRMNLYHHTTTYANATRLPRAICKSNKRISNQHLHTHTHTRARARARAHTQYDKDLNLNLKLHDPKDILLKHILRMQYFCWHIREA